MRPAWIALFLTGCIHVHVPTQTVRSGAGLDPGDRVVARLRSELREATVITVDGVLVTVAWDVGQPERSQLARNWIVRLDERGHGKTARGDWRLCPDEETWVPCLAEPAGQGLALRYADGTKRMLPVEHSLPIPRGLTDWARSRGQKHLDHQALDTDPTPPVVDLSSLRPRAAGRPVSVGDRVIARWSGGGWWEATVSNVSPNQALVSWADGSPATPVSLQEVAPVTADSLLQGDIGLCRWTDTQWWPARILNTSAGRLNVVYSDGTTHDLPHRECVAAVPIPRST